LPVAVVNLADTNLDAEHCPCDGAAENAASGEEFSTGDASPAGRDHLIVDNFTLGQAQIMMGNIGLEEWRKSAGTSTISGNHFGAGIRIMAGNVGPAAAASFNENFWR
jgi:hypothetical protein